MNEPSPLPGVLRPLRALDKGLRKGELVVLVTVLITMIGLSFTTVVMRKMRGYFPEIQEVGWFDILARYLVLWLGILGASIAAREGRHFGVELLPKLFTERGRQRLEAALNFVAGLMCFVLALGLSAYVLLAQPHALFVVDTIHLGVERSWLIAIMPIGFFLMSFRFVLRALEAFLLTHEQWHCLERELKPDLTAAAAPAADPASYGSGAVIEAATPPAVAEAQEVEARKESERLMAPPPVAPTPPPEPRPLPSTPTKAEKSTDEIRIVRLGDLGDVIDPRPEPAQPKSADPDAELVDSDMTYANPPEEGADTAATERQPPTEPGKGGAK
jgi:TRAP-type C4-dicarboxylate transport system permease small subunit